MPIKVFWGRDGIPYAEADTPKEALDLIKLGSNGHFRNAHPAEAAVTAVLNADTIPTSSPDAGMSNLFSSINERAKRFLCALVAHVDGVDANDLSHEIQEPTEAFGGILGGISKNAKRLGLDMDDLIFSEMRFAGPRRYRFLQPRHGLINFANLEGRELVARANGRVAQTDRASGR